MVGSGCEWSVVVADFSNLTVVTECGCKMLVVAAVSGYQEWGEWLGVVVD